MKTGQISEGLNCLEKALVLYEAGNTQDPHYAAALLRVDMAIIWRADMKRQLTAIQRHSE